MRIITAAALVAILAMPGAVMANGVKNKAVFLRGVLGPDKHGSKNCELTSEFEPILFRLTSVENKYRVLRVRIVNRTSRNLALSRTADKVEVVFGDERVNGVIDLPGHDQAFWKNLDPELRDQIIYPQVVEKGGEEESVFVFIPDVARKTAPTAIVYTFASASGTPVQLRQPAATAD